MATLPGLFFWVIAATGGRKQQQGERERERQRLPRFVVFCEGIAAMGGEVQQRAAGAGKGVGAFAKVGVLLGCAFAPEVSQNRAVGRS